MNPITAFTKMNNAMLMPHISGREKARQKAWAELKSWLLWPWKMFGVLSCQVIWMAAVVGVWG